MKEVISIYKSDILTPRNLDTLVSGWARTRFVALHHNKPAVGRGGIYDPTSSIWVCMVVDANDFYIW